MSYEINGKLIKKFEVSQKTESFKTREFVIEKSEDINGRTITNYIKFQCTQDKTSLPDKFSIGDEIKVYFNIKGTKWAKDGNESYFNNLDAWRIETFKLGNENNLNEPPPAYIPSEAPMVDSSDVLPF